MVKLELKSCDAMDCSRWKPLVQTNKRLVWIMSASDTGWLGLFWIKGCKTSLLVLLLTRSYEQDIWTVSSPLESCSLSILLLHSKYCILHWNNLDQKKSFCILPQFFMPDEMLLIQSHISCVVVVQWSSAVQKLELLCDSDWPECVMST